MKKHEKPAGIGMQLVFACIVYLVLLTFGMLIVFVAAAPYL